MIKIVNGIKIKISNQELESHNKEIIKNELALEPGKQKNKREKEIYKTLGSHFDMFELIATNPEKFIDEINKAQIKFPDNN